MKEIDKTTDKKKIVFIIVLVIGIIFMSICGVVALRNYLSSSTKSSTSSKSNSTTNNTNSKSYEGKTISTGGSYTIEGDNSCIIINTSDSVELVLNNATISCENGPAIYVEEAEKVEIVLKGENTITSNTTEELDGAIYSKDDLILQGEGSLKLTSNYDGIVSKDELVIESGNYIINSNDDGIKGRDSLEITGGVFNITSTGDGIKATNEEDSSKGSITIKGGEFTLNCTNDGIDAANTLLIEKGSFTIKTSGSTDSSKGIKAGNAITIENGNYTINSQDDGIHSNGTITINEGEFTIQTKDDGIHADGMVEVNKGTITINGVEGIEATYVKINDGKINITASDDGINAGNKSNLYSVKIEINGGDLTIKMGQGDTDGIDSNGDITVTGGTINITGQSAFDYDGKATYTGGTIIVNGQTINQITNQMMGGHGGANPGGGNPMMGDRQTQRRGMR